MTVSNSTHMLLVEKCIPISHVTLEMVPTKSEYRTSIANFMPINQAAIKKKNKDKNVKGAAYMIVILGPTERKLQSACVWSSL